MIDKKEELELRKKSRGDYIKWLTGYQRATDVGRRTKDKKEELRLREKSQGDFIKWLIERTEFVLLGGRQNVTTRNQGTGSAQGRDGSVRKAYGSVCRTEVKVPE